MSKQFILKPQKISLKLLRELASKGVIGLLEPSKAILSDVQADSVDTMYSSHGDYGSHKMICVRKNATEIRLTTHPENEEVIFINYNGSNCFKPLYLIIATCNVYEFEKKIIGNNLTENDLLAIEVNYNDSLCSYFTINKQVPHCEVTIKGEGEAPVFFVTEPTEMTMAYVNEGEFVFQIS